ncbi:MAG: hypothetical protein I8H66_03455 [Sphingobacteriia bacterium]|nr:hypothetical protein [Sphingobacteriia bacterium]
MENTADETNYERDANGDIRFEMPKLDHSVQRWWRYTYIFHHFNEAQQQYLPYFNIDKYEEGSLEQARKDQEFSEAPLFYTPDITLISR